VPFVADTFCNPGYDGTVWLAEKHSQPNDAQGDIPAPSLESREYTWQIDNRSDRLQRLRIGEHTDESKSAAQSEISMALQSQLFRGNSKLEAAAVSDPAHIVQGDSGEHVRKIQLALIQLDGAALDPDGKYGPGTAAAVLAYKRKRNIINLSYQKQADNIVGKMTMAALDREMVAKESVPARPIQIKVLHPIPRAEAPSASSGGSTLRLGFKFDVDPRDFPGGNFSKIRITPNGFGSLEIVNGIGATIRCLNPINVIGGTTNIGEVFDPALSGNQRNTVSVTRDPHVVHVKGLAPGDAFIEAKIVDGAANMMIVEVRAAALGVVPGQPPTKTPPGRTFVSSRDSEPCKGPVRSGRPVNPRGTGRKINLWGEEETPGFEDYAADLQHSAMGNGTFRPWTEDTDRPPGVASGTASDICTRGSPILQVSIDAIRRMAGPKCRVTFSVNAKFIPLIKKEFPFPPLEEFTEENGFQALVLEFP